MYEIATAPLWSDKKFDGNSKDLAIFKKKLMNRAIRAGWLDQNAGIVNIPEDMDDPDDTFNIITQTTMLTKEQITDWADAMVVNEETRLAQNNFQMYTCLDQSISDELMQRLIPYEDEYTRMGNKIAALFLRLIVTKCSLDTKASVASIRSKLSKLDSSIAKFNSDIKQFNDYTNELMGELRARNETTEDLLTHLFNAYSKVEDTNFRKLITDKESSWLHGADEDLTAEALMSYAEADYNIRVERGTWMELTEDQKQIVALQATIKTMKGDKKGGKAKDSKKRKNDKGGKDRKKAGSSKGTQAKDKNESKWAWKLKKPTDLSSTKEFEGKTYYWCPNHEKWTLHKPSECQKKSEGTTESATNTDDGRATYEVSMALLEEEANQSE